MARGFYQVNITTWADNLTRPGTDVFLRINTDTITGRVCDNADEYIGRRLNPPLPS